MNPGLQVTRLVVVRHGQTAWNAEQRVQGHTDIGLDETGLAQAAALARALADEGVHAVYSSDLARAADTARAFADAAGLEVIIDAGLRERAFGRFEGLRFDDIQARWPDEARRWRQREPGFAPGGGEALERFYRRCVEATEAIARRHRGQTVLLVSHGGVLDCLYRAATRAALDAPRSWSLGNATVNRLLHSDGGLSLVGWDDDAHLTAAAGGEARTGGSLS